MDSNQIFETQDGSHSIISHQFGVSYHSKYGAIKESQHVFIEAGLYAALQQNAPLRILEMGLGTGLNALLTLIEANKHGLALHYTGIEKYPITLEEAQQLNYTEQLQDHEGANQFMLLHECAWDQDVQLGDHFILHKRAVDFSELEQQNSFDLIYYDAFAPTAQPELWELPILQKMEAALRPNGILVTYCAKGSFKRHLKALQLQVETLQGPPGKREMVRARKAVVNESDLV